MAIEGPLSKWTNVMKGWQYRWFVLDESAGLLSYYTSKEKMMRGARRGCVRLKGAVAGIDDDDDSTFTITVDAKTFHFQAHDCDEREKWIRALEDTIIRHAATQWRRNSPQQLPTMADFDKKLTESDAYLQMLIEQANYLEQQCEATDDPSNKTHCQIVLANLNQVLESVKHCIVLLQIAKNTAFPVNGVYQPCNAVPDSIEIQPVISALDRLSTSGSEDIMSVVSLPSEVQTGIEVASECSENRLTTTQHSIPAMTLLRLPSPSVPEVSYSSSEDEDFFDADDFGSISQTIHGNVLPTPSDGQIKTHDGTSGEVTPLSTISDTTKVGREDVGLFGVNSVPVSYSEPYLDYDSMYEEEDEELGSLEGHGSVIQHLISQVKIGMDLTKVVLPTFILERRSLLEMYADFFAHPDLFCCIVDFDDPKDRMVQVVKWYLSAFHAGRKSEVARKPYNPLLGEVFKCYWDIPHLNSFQPIDTNSTSDGPIPWVTPDQLCFVAEQVSHHPPASAFYAEHVTKRISFSGHIWTKSKFLGLSVCVNNIGQGCVSLLDLDEEYILNFPTGYGRSILTVPWVELGGSCQITCSKSGYSANVEFLTKPFYGGKKHRIIAEVMGPGDKKPFLVAEGEWNGVISAKWLDGKSEIFVDTKNMPIMKKIVKPIIQQDTNESRYAWKEVTAGLKFNNINEATAAKYSLEQKQRIETKERKEKNIEWKTKLFVMEGENWVYNNPLQKRIN